MDGTTLDRYQRRKLRTREQIKTAAAELLTEKGYDVLTIQDITDRLDLARATFYVHFRDKDEAIWEVLLDRFAGLQRRIDEEPASDPEWHARKLLQVFQFAWEQRALLRVMFGDRGHMGLSRRIAEYLAGIIEADMVGGRVPAAEDVPAAYTAQFMAGALLRLLAWWLDADSPPAPEQMAAWYYALERRANQTKP